MREGTGVASFGEVAQRLTALQQLTAALARTRSYAQVAGVIIDEALPALRGEVGVVALASEDGSTLRNVGFKGVDQDTQAAWEQYPVSSPVPVAEAARTRQPVIVRTIAERNLRYPVLAEVHGLEHGGPVVALPLLIDGELRGVLAFCWAFALELTDTDLEFLRTLADQCAQAIERARLGELAEREIAERKAVEQALRDAAQRKDEFLAMLAHELRNPLAPIVAAAELLRAVDAPQAKSARVVIQRQTEHMSRLVDDLLDAARAVQGRLQLQTTAVDLVELVRATALDHASSFADRGLALDLRLPADSLWTNADGARVAQALANLLQNARKFSPARGRVAVELKSRSPLEAVVEVVDQGAGIDAELLPRLFEPFAQGDRSLDRSKGGLGLGLSIARAIARLHGGDVTAHSEGPGRGACFRLSLELSPDAQPPVAAPFAWPASPRKRVLVVEDNVDAAEMMGLLLDSFGHDVRLTHHADDALSVLDQWNAQVVLSDIGLPEVDGFTLAQRIRARGNPTFRPLLVAISGYGRDIDRARAHEAGFDLYLTKPVDSRALADALTRG